MGFGDELLAAGQAERLYKSDPRHRRVAICDKDDNVRWHPIWQGNPVIARPESVAAGEEVQRLVNGPNARPYIVYPFTEYTGWTFNTAFRARENIAKIYLTMEELLVGLDAVQRYGPYVLIEPWSKHPNLTWPMAHWEVLVAERPDLTFIQHVHDSSKMVRGVKATIPATFRRACGLVAACEVYVRGESGMLHAAAALQTPSVAIWGGCMDWEVLGGYPLERGVGVTPPACGKWFPCEHCSALMSAITPEMVSVAIDQQFAVHQKLAV